MRPGSRGPARPGQRSAADPTATPVPTPPGPTPTPFFARPTPTPQPTFVLYKVARGDTLTRIAKRFETTGESISYWNRATYPSLDPESGQYRPNSLQVGWVLQILPKSVVDPENLPTLPPSGEPSESPVELRPPCAALSCGRERSSRPRGPRIVITVADATRQSDPAMAGRKNALYVAAVERHGGLAILLDGSASPGQRSDAFEAMDGLLLSGGADLSPVHYGRPMAGARATEPERDLLETEAWAAANARGVPVLGICRGFQAINAFSGGTLVQHVEGHASGAWGSGRPAGTHPLRIAPGTRLARILFPTNVRGGVLAVNSFHHQGVAAGDLAPGLIANARASSPAGELIEGLEAADGRFVIGVQCHPERTDFDAAPFERLFRVFVDAARGPAGAR